MRATRRQHDEISWQKEHVLFGAFHKWRYNYTPSSLDGLVQNKITIYIYLYIHLHSHRFKNGTILFMENPKQKWLTGVAL